MARGGKRSGAGRPLGSATRKTREIANAASVAGQSPLEIILRFMAEAAARGEAESAVKYAAIAAPYVHPRLSSIEARQTPPEQSEDRLDFTKLTTEEIKTFLAISDKAAIRPRAEQRAN